MSTRAWDVLVQHLALTILLLLTLQLFATNSQDFNPLENNHENDIEDHYLEEFFEDVNELSHSRGQNSSADPYVVTTYGENCPWCGTAHRLKGESRKVKVKREEIYLKPGVCTRFKSPNRPSKYPNDIDYRWKYKTSDCSVITLTIQKGSIQKSTGCHRDKLSVKVGKKTIQKCAEFFNFVVDSGDTGEMNIRFATNHRIRWWGYDGTICASKCATTTTTTTTTITTTTIPITTTTTETPIGCDEICGNLNGYTGPGSDADSRGARISSIADSPNRYPWVVLVDVMRDHVFVRCGGYLISKAHVITSAYCFYQETPTGIDGATVRVTAGEYDLTSGEEETGPVSQIIYTSNITKYPAYDYTIGTGVYNIALITIPNGGFTLNSRVSPICMADETMTIPTDLRTSAFGWTKYEFPAVNLTEISLTHCPFSIGDDLLCIYISGNTPCHGDAGSAIYSNVSDTYYSYGHVNAIITNKCPVEGYVLPCVKLSYYQDWIDTITGIRYCNN